MHYSMIIFSKFTVMLPLQNPVLEHLHQLTSLSCPFQLIPIPAPSKPWIYFCLYGFIFLFFLMESHSVTQARVQVWSAMAQSQLTVTSATRVQVILLPQPPK